MGYMDFSGLRYFDGRQCAQMVSKITPKDALLDSDSLYRLDSKTLKEGATEAAQKAKEDIENLQRADRKLREAAAERRKAGGKKFSTIF